VVIALILLVVGLLLAVLEVLVPSGGLLALLSGSSLIAGVVCAWYQSPAWGIGTLVTSMVMVPAVVLAGFRVLPHTALGRRMILAAPEPTEAASADADQADSARSRDGEIPIGAEGHAGNDLRPAGTGRFGDQRVSVVTEGEWIDNGSAIRVVRVEGNRVVVEPIA
jgi:membrane-bound serine protease (ClpP class)